MTDGYFRIRLTALIIPAPEIAIDQKARVVGSGVRTGSATPGGVRSKYSSGPGGRRDVPIECATTRMSPLSS